jgi:hypothetical protein
MSASSSMLKISHHQTSRLIAQKKALADQQANYTKEATI